MKLNLNYTAKYLFLSVILFFQSCKDSTQSNITIEPEETILYENSESEEVKHNPIEVSEEINDVEITEYEEDDNTEYNQEYSAPKTAINRLDELMDGNEYRRSSGRLKRAKIARILNDEGYRKDDGSEFRRRDIPKE